MALVLLVAQAAAPPFPYPGKVAAGEVELADGRTCSLLFWAGDPIAVSLLEKSEKEALASLLREVQEQWGDEVPFRVEAGWVKRYLTLSWPGGRPSVMPLSMRFMKYQHLRLACGETLVRGNFLFFAQAAGFALVAYHQPTNAYLVLVNYLPKAQEWAEDMEAIVKAYRGELEKVKSEAEQEKLPKEVRQSLNEYRKRQEQRERGRIRFVDLNGLYLPNCPGQCPPGSLADAWSRMGVEERKAFAPLLGLLARAGGESTRVEGPEVFLIGTEEAWPKEFGENPVRGLKGELVKIFPPRGFLTFSRPGAALAVDLFGRQDWEPPQVDGQLKDVIKAMRRALQ
ncbi:MAG: hypothetical protein ACUVRQ_08720, partial [Thermoanaerobaculaceae bacterium]